MSPLQWAAPTGGAEMHRALYLPHLLWRVPRGCPGGLATLTPNPGHCPVQGMVWFGAALLSDPRQAA